MCGGHSNQNLYKIMAKFIDVETTNDGIKTINLDFIDYFEQSEVYSSVMIRTKDGHITIGKLNYEDFKKQFDSVLKDKN